MPTSATATSSGLEARRRGGGADRGLRGAGRHQDGRLGLSGTTGTGPPLGMDGLVLAAGREAARDAGGLGGIRRIGDALAGGIHEVGHGVSSGISRCGFLAVA